MAGIIVGLGIRNFFGLLKSSVRNQPLMFALLVEALTGLRHVEAFSGSEPPPDGAPAFFGKRYVDAERNRWQEINLQLLSQLPQFLSISA